MTDSTLDATSGPDELVYVRTVDAPPELVFACMTEPEHLTHFWGPNGTRAPVEDIRVDLRVGGAFETVMVSDADGSRYPTRAVFTDVDPPTTLAWVEPDSGMSSTTTFTDLGDGRTEVRIHQARVPEGYRTAQARSGFATSLDRFETYVATV